MRKSKPPKKCSKYLPEEVLEKHEIGWLQKRQAPFKSTPSNALESFDENMSSMEPCFFREAMNVLLCLCHLVQTIWQSTHPIYLIHPNPSHLSVQD